mmetsp:Transcript_41981/g.118716  ORF Transcript_41981/g.118716 Transcript_41981/m.118716 type:complete len:222 (+) Transcript_41981:371-1036(+)
MGFCSSSPARGGRSVCRGVAAQRLRDPEVEAPSSVLVVLEVVERLLPDVERDEVAAGLALLDEERPVHEVHVQVHVVPVDRRDDVHAQGGERLVRHDPVHGALLPVQPQGGREGSDGVGDAGDDDGAPELVARLDEQGPPDVVRLLVVGDLAVQLPLPAARIFEARDLPAGLGVRQGTFDWLPAPDHAHCPMLYWLEDQVCAGACPLWDVLVRLCRRFPGP